MERQRQAARRSHLRRLEFLPGTGGARSGRRADRGSARIRRGRIALQAGRVTMTPSRGLFVKRCFLSAAVAVVGLALAGGAAAESKCKVTRIAEWPLRAGSYKPVFDGAINGQRIGILVDTGADISLVHRSAAMRLGLTRYRTGGRFFGIGGETHAEYVHIEEFRLGEGVRKNWEVLVAGEGSFSDDVAVLLGDDYFQQVDLEFDLAHNAVRIYDARD